MSAKLSSIKPQDVALLMKIASLGKKEWRQIDLATQMNLSQGEVAKSIQRLHKLELLIEKKIHKRACIEFILHGLKYVFPLEIGALTLGLPTGVSCPEHAKSFSETLHGDVYVWPDTEGTVRGQMVKPFYKGLSKAAMKDKKFYYLMSAIDMLRMGRARERTFAESYLKKGIDS